MLNVVLAEDAPSDARLIREHIGQFQIDHNVDILLRHYPNGLEAVERHTPETDLLLLDIDMPLANGLEIARAIRAIDTDVPICFMTNYSSLAPEGYTVDAMGFLVKPVSYRAFSHMLSRAIERATRKRSLLISFKQGKQIVFTDANEILYVETERKHVVVHTARDRIPCSESMKSLEEKLLDRPFFRIHNAYLVNLAYIQTVTPTDAIVGNTPLPISKHRKRQFLDTLAHYVGSTL